MTSPRSKHATKMAQRTTKSLCEAAKRAKTDDAAA